MRDCLVETVGDGATDEAGGQHDGDEDCSVEACDGPADAAEATDGEDADVEEEHGDADCYRCTVPDYLDGDECLRPSTKFWLQLLPARR